VEAMQKDLDAYLIQYNTNRPHQGRNMNAKTPEKVFKEGLQKKRVMTRTEADF
jgi:hypothetical protein